MTASRVLRPLAATPIEALQQAGRFSPYLRALAQRLPEPLARLGAEGPDAVVGAACRAVRLAVEIEDPAEIARLLRLAKAEIHLACAGADLAGLWPQEQATLALSCFADLAVAAALAAAARRLGGFENPLKLPGFIVLAMGKLGAYELNYSSDIDLTIFYDPQSFGEDAKRRAVRLTQFLAQILEERTEHGYVFRVDLRLRPDPASTPVALSTAYAENYYQSLGQNWERAAFIKARPCAGDCAAGEALLQALASFRWRRHLDFAAIADIRSIKRQIVTGAGAAALNEPCFDLKRDTGGIRDIELFVQTQQLILGGRNPELREPGTLQALTVLAKAGAVDPEDAALLARCYGDLRGVEHRLQMLEDEQTHAVPAAPEAQARLAGLCGRANFAELAASLVALRRAVAGVDAKLFSPGESLADPLGALSFTGVEDDPATLETLRRLGFAAPEQVTETIRGWHHGRVRATRSERARELLTELTPTLLRAISETGDADAAFRAFAAFFGALPAGVQALSLFAAQPKVLRELAQVFATAPRLARLLGQRPAALDSLLEARVEEAIAADDAAALVLRERVRRAGDLERSLDEARRFHRDEGLRIALHLLAGRIDGVEAGRALTRLADACSQSLFEAVALDLHAKRRLPRGPMALMGLGKLGGGELAAGSDLDVMLLYDPLPEEGPEPYARVAQALISALSAPTAEGPLYDIDMQLRPSGSKGPIAVRLSSFARYYEEEAWTWELLALTRLRFVAGNQALGAAAMGAAHAALALPRDPAALVADALAMRERMDAQRPPRPGWDLKLGPGGMVDIEFAVQTRLLAAARRWPDAVRAHTGEAIARLAELGALAVDQAQALEAAWRRLTNLSQLQRAAHGQNFDPAAAPALLLQRLAEAGGQPDFAALVEALQASRQGLRALSRAVIEGSARI